jgi:hypothetical protein
VICESLQPGVQYTVSDSTDTLAAEGVGSCHHRHEDVKGMSVVISMN